MDNPYRIPDDRWMRTINFSGGRSSAYMLFHILDAHDGRLPNSAVVCFTNTGKERPETLDFIKECGERWNVPIVWLEYRYRTEAAGGRKEPKHAHVVVDHATASRNGEPFEQMIDIAKILPNVAIRKCTSELKVRTLARYCDRDLGWHRKDVRNILGLRHDEPRRWSKALFEHCKSEFPMVHARVDKGEVMRFWREQDFDLGIDSEHGNCDACFLKGAGHLVRMFRSEPSVADWWIEQEAKCLNRWQGRVQNENVAQFIRRHTYTELLDRAKNEPEFPFMDDDEREDCFCTD